TQGEPGMELSLVSRDVIAMATAVALSHNMYDAALCLGICDKIVPGLLMGALRFGHLPVLFVPAGPMPSGLPNDRKAQVRQRYAAGPSSWALLMSAESQAVHAPATCTFYATATTLPLLLAAMALQFRAATFVNPGSPLRAALTVAVSEPAARLACTGQ